MRSAKKSRRFLIVTIATSILSFKKSYARKYKSPEASFRDMTGIFRKHTTEIIEKFIEDKPEFELLGGIIDRFCYNLSKTAMHGADKYIKEKNTPMVFQSFVEHLSLGLIDSMYMGICDWNNIGQADNKDQPEGQLRVDIEINFDRWSFRWYGRKEMLYSNCEVRLNNKLFSTTSNASEEDIIIYEVIKPVAFEYAKQKQAEKRKMILYGRGQDMAVLQRKVSN